jgi:hypothetical protein
MSNSTIVYPVYYRLVVRCHKIWHFTKGEQFINLFNAPWLKQKNLFVAFDTLVKQVANSLIAEPLNREIGNFPKKKVRLPIS